MSIFSNKNNDQPKPGIDFNQLIEKAKTEPIKIWRTKRRVIQISPRQFQRFSLFFVIMVFVIFISSFFRNSYELPVDNQSLEEKLKILEERQLNKQLSKKLNFAEQKRKAMDSLVDHKALTPENIALIEKRYPDSICDCP